MQGRFLLILIPLTFAGSCGGSERAGQTASAPPHHGAQRRATSGRVEPRAASDRVEPRAAAKPPKAAPTPDPEPGSLPTECIPHGEFCLPPSDFVDRLCEHSHPDAAVYMMGPEQPWTHRYVLVQEAQAINPINGRVGEAKLTFGEEVLILRFRTATSKSGIQVSGTEHYEVLRWDGSCATLEPGEFVEQVPEKQRRFVVPTWKRIGDSYKALLLKETAVADAEARRKTDCKGVGLGRQPKCYEAMEALNGVIAEVVKGGLKLPPPDAI